MARAIRQVRRLSLGVTKHGLAGRGLARLGEAGKGKAGLGWAGLGEARQGSLPLIGHSKRWFYRDKNHGMHGRARHGGAWQGAARRGWAGLGVAWRGEAGRGQPRRGRARRSTARWGLARQGFLQVKGFSMNVREVIAAVLLLPDEDRQLVFEVIGAVDGLVLLPIGEDSEQADKVDAEVDGDQ